MKLSILAVVATCAALAPASAASEAPGGRYVAAVVARAAGHVRAFVDAAAVLIADEHYVQELKARTGLTTVPSDGSFGITVEKRTLESEVALVQMADKQLWMLGRDVRAVDGRAVADRDRVPLAAWRPASMEEALKRFRELATQSARFNIGGITRNVNVPSLALWFLTDGVRDRFAFTLGKQERIDGETCAIVHYREKSSPFLLMAEGRSVPVRGRFWIAPDTGAVRRTELLLYNDDTIGGLGDIHSDAGRALVVVQYRYAADVAAWVPSEMTERYDYPKVMNADVVVGRAEYRNFRKFSVTSRIVQ
jgi:hypothetical protein